MSRAGLDAKKAQTENYFIYHPDSIIVEIDGSTVTFPALFDYSFQSNNRDEGNVEQKKRVPHLTLYSGNAGLIAPRVTKLIIEGKLFQVLQVQSDLTEGTFQTDAWLL